MMLFSEELRQAVERDPRPVGTIAKAAGLSPIQLWRFLNDERGLTTPAVDALCEELGLQLVARRKRGR